MTFDSSLMLRAAAAGNLTADETGSYFNLGAPPKDPLVVRVVVPAMAETNDTLIVKINLSANGSSAAVTISMPTITKANVDAGLKEFYFTLPPSRYQYVSADMDITDADAGSDFNAGAVQVGITPSGRHQTF